MDEEERKGEREVVEVSRRISPEEGPKMGRQTEAQHTRLWLHQARPIAYSRGFPESHTILSKRLLIRCRIPTMPKVNTGNIRG
jgi:hypothetical protein